MHPENIGIALALSTFAGLSTGIGSVLGVLGKSTNRRLLSAAMGFSAGMMVYVSLVELLPVAIESLGSSGSWGAWWALVAFLGGMGLIAVIDRFVPSPENPHEFPSAANGASPRATEDASRGTGTNKLMRLGLMTTIVLAVHNFPEGIATLLAGLQSTEVGVPIALAVAIHNIPEGIAVAVPIHQATGNRWKAFGYSFFSGLAEPLGAIVGYALLMPFLTEVTFGLVYAAIAGIMVFISFDQLLPAAERYGEHHASTYGVVAGMLVMAASLIGLG